MTTIKRLTVTMPKEFKRQLMLDQLTVLKQDIDKGLADVAAGRTREFDAQ